MRKILKFLKPHMAAVLSIVAVLIVQAYCDLSLPSYTSDIVNIGIQQGGCGHPHSGDDCGRRYGEPSAVCSEEGTGRCTESI